MESKIELDEEIKSLLKHNDRKETLAKALFHMNKVKFEDLSSNMPMRRGSAKGYLYESYYYELIKENIGESRFTLINRMKDVNKKSIEKNPNGLSYNKDGTIVFKGEMQDLAEFDFILKDKNDDLYFLEISMSGANVGGLQDEVIHKRLLLNKILEQESIHFFIISGEYIGRKNVIKEMMESDENHLVDSDKVENVIQGHETLTKRKSKPVGIDIDELTFLLEFDYKKYYKRQKMILYNNIRRDKSIESIEKKIENPNIVSKVLMGNIFQSTVRNSDIILDCEGFEIPVKEAFKYFDKAVLAISIPELRPSMYLRTRWKYKLKKKDSYLKFGLIGSNRYKFEKNIPVNVDFYHNLLNCDDQIYKKMFNKIIEKTDRESVYLNKQKKGKANFKN